MTRFTVPIAVFLLLIKDNQVLLMRRKNTGWGDGSYETISGHIDGNEHFATALAREAKEEAGITVQPQDAKFVGLTHCLGLSGNKEYVYVAFAVTKWEGEPTICEPEFCDELAWFPLDNLPDNLTPGAKVVLDAYNNGELYSEMAA